MRQLQQNFPIFLSLKIDDTGLLAFVTHFETQAFDVLLNL